MRATIGKNAGVSTPDSVHLVLALLLLAGLSLGLLASRLGLPRVVAYVLGGVLFSPSLLGDRLGLHVGEWAAPLTGLALGVIAYLIGGSITIGQLRRTGRVILGALVGQSFGAMLFVFVPLSLLLPASVAGIPGPSLALAFSAIAVTTAPAATVAVLHQYRARGPVATTLLGVVVLDDAVGIILFAVAMAVAASASLAASLGAALLEILGSVALGTVVGVGLSLLARLVRQGALRLPVVFIAVLLTIGVAGRLELSALLASMTTGFVSRHAFGAAGDRLFAPVEYFEELVFLVFFTVAGAHFDPRVFVGHLDLIAVYFVMRMAGKLVGAAAGARLVGAPLQVVRWLGVGLVPQAGVAVGLALAVDQVPALRGASDLILNVILGTTLLYEMVGPFAVRYALGRAGELGVGRNSA